MGKIMRKFASVQHPIITERIIVRSRNHPEYTEQFLNDLQDFMIKHGIWRVYLAKGHWEISFDSDLSEN